MADLFLLTSLSFGWTLATGGDKVEIGQNNVVLSGPAIFLGKMDHYEICQLPVIYSQSCCFMCIFGARIILINNLQYERYDANKLAHS